MAGEWRTKAKELAALVAALPEEVRAKVDDSLAEAVKEILMQKAMDTNDAGTEEQLICMFGADGLTDSEGWLRDTIAECEQEVREGI